ncbi:hypothetical protein BpHYR1_005245, partial [Brachionus plicatilis]
FLVLKNPNLDGLNSEWVKDIIKEEELDTERILRVSERKLDQKIDWNLTFGIRVNPNNRWIAQNCAQI